MKNHGSPYDSERHVGDLGNVLSDGKEETYFSIIDNSISLLGKHSVVGRSIVITKMKTIWEKEGSKTV